MHKLIDQIKKNESGPYIVNDFLNHNEVELFQKLYTELVDSLLKEANSKKI